MLYIERRVENNEEDNNIYISIVNSNLTKKMFLFHNGQAHHKQNKNITKNPRTIIPYNLKMV